MKASFRHDCYLVHLDYSPSILSCNQSSQLTSTSQSFRPANFSSNVPFRTTKKSDICAGQVRNAVYFSCATLLSLLHEPTDAERQPRFRDLETDPKRGKALLQRPNTETASYYEECAVDMEIPASALDVEGHKIKMTFSLYRRLNEVPLVHK